MVNHNGLKTVQTKELKHLLRIQKLDLSTNHITKLSRHISLLSRLSALNLSNNNLETVPSTISLCSNLRALHLNNNVLTSIPVEIMAMTHLVDLQLMDNPQLLTSIGKNTCLIKVFHDRNRLGTIRYGNPLHVYNVPNDVRRQIYAYIPCPDEQKNDNPYH